MRADIVQRARNERLLEKIARAEYIEARQAEVSDLNEDIVDRLSELAGILDHTLRHDDTIDFDSMKHQASFPPFNPPQVLVDQSRDVAPLGKLKRLIPGAERKHSAMVEAMTKSRDELARLHRAYESERSMNAASTAARNMEIDDLRTAYMDGEENAIVAYNEMVLARSEYPSEGFEQNYRLAYRRDSAELIVEYELPPVSVVPQRQDFRYIKARDAIESKPRKASEIKDIYRDVIAGVALRTLHELCEADQADVINLVVFNGYIDSDDPASGHPVRVPLVSVRTSKDAFRSIKLDRIEKSACLRGLGAKISSRPDELQAVKPIVDFDMVDKRFVDQGDAIALLESRPNLLDMTPSQFEALVANLFSAMGLDTKLTRSSRDGGVDAVAFDLRPVLGGKVVIQAKRYRDTVGVSAVRDLFGTMLNEGANKGILVCTSSYGPDAYNFSKDKPIELIDGGGLLYLLREHAGVDARIIAP